MRAIFISYRREDAEGHAGRLFEDLVQRFGSASVFMDVADIEPGRDFRRVIEQQVASCGVLLAVIGKSWLDVTDAQGRRRLDDPADFVGLETSTALKRDIPVIPVLVHGASMPRADQLPDALKDLAYRNSVELTHARWSSDVQLLVRALMPYVDASASAAPAPALGGRADAAAAGARRGNAPLIAAGAVLAVAAVGGIGYMVWGGKPAPAPAIVAADAGSPPASQAVPAAPPPSSGPVSTPVISTPVTGTPATNIAAPAPRAETTTATAAPSPPRHHASAPLTAAVPRPADTEVAAAAPAPAPAPSPAPAPVVTAPAPVPDSTAADPEAVPSRADPALAIYGERVKVAFATRTIVITPATNYVNVTGGEIVRFAVGNKAIAWNFNGRSGSFDLARAAPALIDHKVTAYIAPNPYYPRSGG